MSTPDTATSSTHRGRFEKKQRDFVKKSTGHNKRQLLTSLKNMRLPYSVPAGSVYSFDPKLPTQVTISDADTGFCIKKSCRNGIWQEIENTQGTYVAGSEAGALATEHTDESTEAPQLSKGSEQGDA